VVEQRKLCEVNRRYDVGLVGETQCHRSPGKGDIHWFRIGRGRFAPSEGWRASS